MRTLIRAAQQGSACARRELVARLSPRLQSMAGYYSRRSNLEAEDLLQEAWCAVFEALPETQLHIGTPQEYLITRARWAMLDYLKWSVRRQMQPLEETGEAPALSQEPETVLKLSLRQLAEDMTPAQQSVLELLMAGETCTSAAAALGCTTANVSYHLGQVRRQMQGLFAEAELATA